MFCVINTSVNCVPTFVSRRDRRPELIPTLSWQHLFQNISSKSGRHSAQLKIGTLRLLGKESDFTLNQMVSTDNAF